MITVGTRSKVTLAAVVFSMLTAVAHANGGPRGASSATSLYTTQAPSRGGTGKIYMGREISEVMGHRGAAWLERPSRVLEEWPDKVVARMDLEPEHVVADLGAGTGYFTFRISPRVPRGHVYAVDIQQEMLDIVRERTAHRGTHNVTPVLGTSTDPKLAPNSIDMVLLVDAYHEFSHPYAIMTAVMKALKPGGRVLLVEYRAEDPKIAIKRLHKMSVAQARMEMDAVGLRWVETLDFLPTQHFMVFEKLGIPPTTHEPKPRSGADHLRRGFPMRATVISLRSSPAIYVSITDYASAAETSRRYFYGQIGDISSSSRHQRRVVPHARVTALCQSTAGRLP